MSELLPYFIYGVFAVGGAGVYFALPRSGRSTAKAGGLLGLAAVAMLVVVAASYAAPREWVGFSYLFSAIALLAAGRVVTHPKPVYCVLYFVLLVVAVACLLVLQHAEFLAVALVIIYAGAILVTYVFVIMLAQQSVSAPHDVHSREPFWAVLAGFVTMAAIAGQVAHLPGGPGRPVVPPGPDVRLVSDEAHPDPSPVPSQAEGNTAAVGRELLTTYVLTLEVAGLLLLVAMIGAIAIAKKRVPAEEIPAAEKPLGQIGKEVPPF